MLQLKSMPIRFMPFRFRSLSAVALFTLSAHSAHAGIFDAKPKPVVPPPAASPAASGSTNLAADPPSESFHKATRDQIQQALRSDPLTQAAFFNNQFEHDPTDTQTGLYLSNALRGL